jgi:hypothetical protein
MTKEAIPSEGKFDIVLSPELYVIRKEASAVRSARVAKRIARSVLAPYVDSSDTLRYFVFRCGEEWCFIGYDTAEIERLLEEKAVPRERAGKLYFVQQFADRFSDAVEISPHTALWTADGIVTQLPFVPEGAVPVENITFRRPQLGASLDFRKGGLSLRSTVILSVVGFAFAAMWSAEGFRYKAGVSETERIYKELVAKNPKLEGRYVRESLLRKYETLDRMERQKRETVRAVSSAVSSSAPLRSLAFDEKGYEVRIGCNGRKCADKTARILREAGLKVISRRPDEVRAEGVWK